MLRGYRRYVFAVVGCLTLAAANPPAQKQQNRAGTAPAKPPPPPEAPYAPYPDLYAEACYKAKDHNAADLCAQWRAALAAEKAAQEAHRATDWAIVATIIGALTIIGLIVTIWQTHGALGEARRGNRLNLLFEKRARRKDRESAEETAEALKYARDSARAMAKLANVSARNAEAQLRAYLDFDGIRFMEPEVEGSEVPPGVMIVIRNYGHTPAEGVEITATFKLSIIGDEGPPMDLLENQMAPMRFGIIAPNDTSTWRMMFSIPPHMWTGLKVRMATLHVHAHATYLDKFGGKRVLETSYESDGTRPFSFVEGTRVAT